MSVSHQWVLSHWAQQQKLPESCHQGANPFRVPALVPYPLPVPRPRAYTALLCLAMSIRWFLGPFYEEVLALTLPALATL